MPGIVTLGRRWSVGSDDMIIPAVLLLLTNFAWVAILGSYGIEFVIEAYETTGRRRFIVGMSIYAVVLLLCIICEALIIFYSLRGSILDAKRRDGPVISLMYIRIVLFVLQLISSIIGLIFSFEFDVRMTGTKRILALTVWELVLLALLIYCMWDSAGDIWLDWRHKKNKDRYEMVKDAYLEAWDQRCKTMCCCVDFNAATNARFQEVAKVFSELFVGEDVVPTDIITALVLLDQKRKLTERLAVERSDNNISEYCSGVPITDKVQYLPLNQSQCLQEFRAMYHYMHYAWASYGWFYHLSTNVGCTKCCKWMCGLDCCSCCCCPGEGGNRDFEFEGADCAKANTSAILNSFPPDSDAQMFYMTFLNSVVETPFFIVIDHGKSTIVIIPRGTMSFDDAVTDALLDPVPIPFKQIHPDWQGHSGMTAAAAYMYNKITNEQLIERAQERRRGEEQYGLVVVGHSLGAGTAPLLALLLHQDYPGLRCFAFSPPGGLFSVAAIEGSKHYITSVVVGDDVIPRIGLNQFRRLRHDIVDILSKVDSPKYSILCGNVFGRSAVTESVLANEHPVCSTNQEPVHEGDSSLVVSMATAISIAGCPLFTADNNKLSYTFEKSHPTEQRVELYPPGRLIHIVKSLDKGTNEVSYLPIVASNDSLDGIIVDMDMLMDHRGDTVLNVMQQLIDSNSNAIV